MARKLYFVNTPESNEELQGLIRVLRLTPLEGQVSILHESSETYQEIARSLKEEFPTAQVVGYSKINFRALIDSPSEFIILGNWDALSATIDQILAYFGRLQPVKDQYGVMLNIDNLRQQDNDGTNWMKISMQLKSYNKRLAQTMAKIKDSSGFVNSLMAGVDLETLENKIDLSIQQSTHATALLYQNPNNSQYLINPILRQPRILTQDLVALSLHLKENRERNIFSIHNLTSLYFPNIILRELNSETNLHFSELQPQDSFNMKKYSLFHLMEEQGLRLFRYCIMYNSVIISNTCEQGICDLVLKKNKLHVKNLTSSKLKCNLNLTHNGEQLDFIELTLIAIRTIKQDVSAYPRPLIASVELQGETNLRISPIIKIT